jgi:hypothetical protein
MWRSVTSALPIAVDGNALPHLITKIVSRAVYGAAKAARKDSPKIKVKLPCDETILVAPAIRPFAAAR